MATKKKSIDEMNLSWWNAAPTKLPTAADYAKLQAPKSTSTFPSPKEGSATRMSNAKVTLTSAKKIKLPTIKATIPEAKLTLGSADDKFRGKTSAEKLSNAVDDLLAPIANTTVGKIATRGQDAMYKIWDKQSGVDKLGKTGRGDGKAGYVTDTGSEVGNAVGDIIGFGGTMIANTGGGSVQGALSPIGNATAKVTTKGLEKLAPSLPSNVNKVANYVLPTLAKEGVEGAIQGGTLGVDDGVQGVAKEAAKGAVENAAFGMGLKGVGSIAKGFSHTLGKLGKVKITSDDGINVNYIKEDGSIGIMKKAVFEKEATPLTINEGAATLNQERPFNYPEYQDQFHKGDYSNKYTVKNTALEKAQQEYDNAIEEIHNRFGHYKLIPEEVKQIKDEMGIDINKLADNLAIAKTEATKVGEKVNMANIAGVQPTKQKTLINPFKEGLLERTPSKTQPEPVTATQPIKQASTLPMVGKPVRRRVSKQNVSLEPTLSLVNKEGRMVANNAVGGNPITGEQKLSKHFETVKNTPVIDEHYRENAIKEADYMYNVKSNEADFDQAARNIQEKGADAVIEEHLKDTSDKLTSVQVMENVQLTKTLFDNLVESQKDEDALRLKTFLESNRQEYTELGQSMQAISAYKKTTPEGVLMMAQGKVNGYVKALRERDPDLMKKVDAEVNAVKKESKAQIDKEVMDEITNDVMNGKGIPMNLQMFAEVKKAVVEAVKKGAKTEQELKAQFKQLDMFGTFKEQDIDLLAQGIANKINKLTADRTAKVKLKEEEKILTIFKKYDVPNLSVDDVKFISETMAKASKMADGDAKNVELAKVKKVVANLEPSTNSDKVRGLQRISMLLNPKTLVTRNPLGNILLAGIENLKDIPATALDKAVSKKTGVRTTGLPMMGVQGKEWVGGLKTVKRDADLGINTSMSAGKYDLPMKTNIWNEETTKGIHKAVNKGLNKADSIVRYGLRLGDDPFLNSAYQNSLQNQMKLNKVDVPTDEMIAIAKKDAEHRTLQNDSKIAESFDHFRKALNGEDGKHIGRQKFGFGNLVLPFTKTPANIIDKAIDYSPVGLGKAMKEATKLRAGKIESFDQKKFVDSFGRGVVGTTGIVLGAVLASQGKITGAAPSDYDTAALLKISGQTPYSFKVGDGYYTFDWAQPATVPLAIGADMFNNIKDKEGFLGSFQKAVSSGANTIFQQSLVQSLEKLFGNYDGLPGGIMAVLSDAPTQFMPTLGKQLAQTFDEVSRSSYDPNAGKVILNKMGAKLPGVSNTLEPKINTIGEETKTNGDVSLPERLFDIYLNPGVYSKKTNDSGVNLVKTIYEKTGETIQMPRIADKSFKDGDGNTIKLTAKEYTKYQTLLGQRTKDYLDSINDTGDYEKMAENIQSKITAINKEVKNEILSQRELPMLKTSSSSSDSRSSSSSRTSSSSRSTSDRTSTSGRTSSLKR